jgi:hypothetical protein
MRPCAWRYPAPCPVVATGGPAVEQQLTPSPGGRRCGFFRVPWTTGEGEGVGFGAGLLSGFCAFAVGEHKTNTLGSLAMARRPEREKSDALSAEDPKMHDAVYVVVYTRHRLV